MSFQPPRRVSTLPVRFDEVNTRPERDFRQHLGRRTDDRQLLQEDETRPRIRRDNTLTESGRPADKDSGGIRQHERLLQTIADLVARNTALENERHDELHSRGRGTYTRARDGSPEVVEVREERPSPSPDRRFRSPPSYSPPPRRSVRRQADYRTYDTGAEGSDSDDDVFEFAIPRPSASTYRAQSESSPVLIWHDRKENLTQASLPTKSDGRTFEIEACYNILESKYGEDGRETGDQRVNLSVVEDSKANLHSLYRWVHFQDPIMNFDDFLSATVNLPGLDAVQRDSITRLLRRVKSKLDKPYQSSKSSLSRLMIPDFVSEAISSNSTVKQIAATKSFLNWICVPYFSYEQYVDQNTGLRNGAHPVRTILEARSAHVAGQEGLRETTGGLSLSQSGLCYHVSQLWCLIVSNRFLITCSRMPINELLKDYIATTIMPSPELYRNEAQRIIVSYGAAVMWKFEFDECRSWYSLMFRFAVFPMSFKLYFDKQEITPTLWPRLLSQSKVLNDHLRLTLRESNKKPTLQKGVLRKRDDISETTIHRAQPGRSTSTTSVSPGRFFVLTLLGEDCQTDDAATRTLMQNLDRMARFLRDDTNLLQSLAYKSASQSSYSTVRSYLQEQANRIAAEPDPATNPQASTEDKREHGRAVDLFNAAESVFEFFLPVRTQADIASKYWGAIHKLLAIPMNASTTTTDAHDRSASRFTGSDTLDEYEQMLLSTFLASTAQRIQPYKDLLSQATFQDQSGIEIPDELVQGWLHLVMTLVFASLGSESWQAQSRKATKLLEAGSNLLMDRLSKGELQDHSVVMPQEIVSILSQKLLLGISSTEVEKDIASVYTQYLLRVKDEIVDRPLDRGHKAKLIRFRQEAAVILRQLEYQKLVFAEAESFFDRINSLSNGQYRDENTGTKTAQGRIYYGDRKTQRQHTYHDYDHGLQDTMRVMPYNDNTQFADGGLRLSQSSTKFSVTDPSGYRDLLLQECLDIIESNYRAFEDLLERADELRDNLTEEKDKNKDRQENAIFAFTVVTIIFLPLSTVAGILGMNTNDVRNMNVDQWVFWATAIPLLLVILFLCLLWTNELGNIWKGFRDLWRPKIHPLTFELPADFSKRLLHDDRRFSKEGGYAARDNKYIYPSRYDEHEPPVPRPRRTRSDFYA